MTLFNEPTVGFADLFLYIFSLISSFILIPFTLFALIFAAFFPDVLRWMLSPLVHNLPTFLIYAFKVKNSPPQA